jgi:hypothetical protein
MGTGMGDYNLSGLSTRSFEQLIQALAAKIIGPGTIIFGDGPDGGREATFEGAVSYPTKDDGWNGYLVIQAKFKQRLQDSQKDGEWALKQLRHELEIFANPKKNRRLPDYYIFATNVVFTPVLEQGTKDKAAALFQQFKKKVPVRGYAIWDYDQICTFLDDAEDIRHSYAAWITAGDVLAQVIDWLKPEKKDFEQTLSNFLQKELQTDQYANLEQAGHAIEDRIPIARVFIDAPALDHSTLEPPDEKPDQLLPGFVCKLLRTAAERLDPESQGKQFMQGNRPEHFPRREPGRFVLIGGPGQGKTTFGQFICQLFRAAILKDKGFALAAETRQALAVIEAQCQKESITIPTARRFPVRIVLSEFAAMLARKETNSLLSYVADRICKRTNQFISMGDFKKWLHNYPWLLILDGLDEVPASSNREEVMTAVRDFWVDATECNADILVVATTRPQGYSQEFSLEFYRHYWLAPLSTARALHYARRLVEARYDTEQDRREKILSRLKSASGSDATARLMRSPLQVTIMAALVDKVGKPPQERWTLFRDYYKIIYDREVERDIPAAEILRDYKPDVDTIHYRVGLLLQIEGESSGRTDARLSTARLTEIIRGRLVEEEHNEAEVKVLQEKITKAAAERLVFLAGVEADRVGFEIRSFQEFMAAECLMEGDDKSVRERLREIAPIAYWRNVFLFAAGKCFAERQHLRDIILALCDEMNEDPDDEAFRVTLAGSQLALDLLEDGPARRQPKYAQALARKALRLLDLQPNDYHKRLGELYEPGLEHVYREEVEQRLSLSNFKQRLGGWACLSHLIEFGVSWADEIVKTNWPDLREEKLELLSIASNKGTRSKIFSMLVKSLPLFSLLEMREGDVLFDVLRTRRKPSEKAETLLALSKIDPMLPAIVAAFDPHSWCKNAVVQLQNSSESGLKLSYQSIDPKTCGWLSLKGLTAFHSDWSPYIAAARFLENPSRLSLAEELRFIAKSWTERPHITFGIPWPIGACCAEAHNENELLAIAERAESGEFGDIEDWRKAEMRWQNTGIIADDFYYATDDHWPFDKLIAMHGFPFNICGRYFHDVSRDKSFSSDLLRIYEKLEQSRVRSFLAGVLLFFVTAGQRSGTSSRKVMRYNLRQLRSLFNESRRAWHWFNLDLFDSLKDDIFASDEWLDFIDQIGKTTRLLIRHHEDKRISSTIAGVFCSNPSLTGFLRIFSCILHEGDPSLIPAHLLNPDRYDDALIKEAAIIVRLAQKNLSKDEQASLAKCAAEIVRQQSGSSAHLPIVGLDMIERALDVISRYETGDSLIEHFLLELRRNLQDTEWTRKSRIVETLIQILRLRLSHLRDPQVWSELRLPAGLGTILRI